MDSNPEIKFNFNIHEICKTNKLLIDNTGNLVIPLFRYIDDLNNRKLYNIQQIYNHGFYFEHLINNIKMKIDYEINNNIDPNTSIILHNKYMHDYSIFKAGANYNIAQIRLYTANELIGINQKIFNIINPLNKLIEKIYNDINKTFDISFTFAKMIEWKIYMQPLKDQYYFLNEQKNYTIEHIKNQKFEIQDLQIKIPIFYNYYNKLTNLPTFIPFSVMPPPLPTEPIPQNTLQQTTV